MKRTLLKIHILIFSIFFTLILFSCKKNSDVAPIATEPTKATAISKTSAAKGESVSIAGSNFGTSLSALRVTANGAEATIVSSDGTNVVFNMPTFSPAPTSPITVLIYVNGVLVGTFTITYNFTTVIRSVTNGQVGYLMGPFATAKIEEIVGLTSDSLGNIYSCQYTKPRVLKFGIDGSVSTMAGDGTVGDVYGNGTAAKLGRMDCISSDPAGNIFVADQTSTHIKKIDPLRNVTDYEYAGYDIFGIKYTKTNQVYFSGSVAGNPDQVWKVVQPLHQFDISIVQSAGTGDLDGPFGTARFSLYGNIEVSDDEKKIYINQTNNSTLQESKVKVIDLVTNTVTTIAGKTGVNSGDGPALNAGFKRITCTLLDKTGGLYIADGFNHAIRYLKNGQVTTIVGSAGQGDIDGPLATAKINYPTGMALNSKGELFIACVGNNKLKK
jgi:IPT/TIG domain